MPAPEHWNGILMVDKPPGMTSHDVVAKVRYFIGQRGVGHTGTLDPRATGLLVMCLGRATKIVQFISNFDKTYIADICFGRTSTTYDAEGLDDSVPVGEVPELSDDRLNGLLAEHTGKVRQVVPAYSAVKVRGVPLHRSARRGEEVELPEREVEFKSLRLLSYHAPYMRIELTCSKGAYVRSLAHDMGSRLGCGAYLAELRRTMVGEYSVNEAVTLDELIKRARSHRLAGLIVPLEKVLHFGAFQVSDDFGRQVVNGRALKLPDLVAVDGDFHVGDRVVLKDSTGNVLAIGTAGVDSGAVGADPGKALFSYLRVLN
jgi:tRNA pseudouridine55 synthase